VVKGLPVEWEKSSHTATLYDGPLALVCWKDIIAVGLKSSDIIILNAITGSQMAALSGHTNWVKSLSFSSDGTSLVSGSVDETLKLWDVQTGGVVKTFCGHTGWVLSVSISPDYTTIASGSRDGTIRLWDIQTGECSCIIKQQEVYHVVFSPTHPQHLISASGGVVQEWDINCHQVGHTHEGSSTVFSIDGTHFISCQKNIATVRNLQFKSSGSQMSGTQQQ
jgi:WD40 repeat protein